ncbi:MAG: ParB/RepB/Spo0J family partition protein [Lachnospiraceae bacterium]|nr:ParB/RepB/Spo0J family partition protein [Lachnospiraceae bacterium]
MASTNTKLEDYMADQLKRYGNVMVPVKASSLERAVVKWARTDKLHPNPDDEFCFPQIGPNYQIISKYEKMIRQFGTIKPDISDEPLMVEKVSPEGYMILNGHHRWAAAMRCGLKWVPISIVNLTQETDIEKMVMNSEHDRRITLDLDEVVFCKDENVPAEKPLHFPYNRMYKERIRLGIPALLHNLGMQGYDIWIYTAKYYSFDYVRDYFKKYSVKLDGIVTGTARKMKGHSALRHRTNALIGEQYNETIHIDMDAVLRTFEGSKEFEDYEIKADPSGWTQEVTDIIKDLRHSEKR